MYELLIYKLVTCYRTIANTIFRKIQIIRGFIYHCRTCYEIDFCYKCYGRKENIHEAAHEWDKIGQEFEDYESSWSDEDEIINDDERKKINEEHSNDNSSSDSSSDSSSTSDDS